MASSQVEVASSSPFGCVLRDHNRRERYIESNARVAIQKNLKDLVQSCISAPSVDSESDPNESSCNVDSSGKTKESNNGEKNNNTKFRILDRWAKARDMVFQRETSPARTDSSVEIQSIRAVSSLVQRWRNIETESKNLNLNSNNNNSFNSACSSRSNSGSIFTENSSFLEVPMRNSDECESVCERFETPSVTEDSFMDWESDRTDPSGTLSVRSRDANATEKERIRVADIIKRLTSVNGEDVNDREQFVASDSLPRIRTSLEIRGFGAAIASPRIRGRQAFNDLLVQMERDRHGELESLGERKAVSRFSHRGRIQALLRVRFLRHQQEVKNGGQPNSTSERNQHSQRSSVMHLRERFKTGLEQGAVDLRPCKEVINSNQDAEKSSAPDQTKQVIDHFPSAERPSTSKQLKEKTDRTCNMEKPSPSNQLKEEIHPLEVTYPTSPCRTRVDENTNVETCSISNCNLDVGNPTFNSLKREINSWELNQPRSPLMSVVDDTPSVETFSTSDRLKVDINHHVAMASIRNSSQLQKLELSQKEVSPSVDVMWQETSKEAKMSELQNSAEAETSLNGRKDENKAIPIGKKEQSITSLHDWVNVIVPSQENWEQQESNKVDLVETGPDWTNNNFSQAPSDWEEDRMSYQRFDEYYQDWISDIARPRSDWEGLRQERYKEMLDPFAENGDIKELLERRSVSTFLSGELRERIDQLMISRTQGQSIVVNNPVEIEQVEEKVVRNELEQQDIQLEKPTAEQYEEDEDHIGRQYCEVDEYFNETPSSINSAPRSFFRSWSCNRDNDTDDSVGSSSQQQYLSFNSRTLNNQGGISFKNHHPSIEMELIYDLRGHMEQLHWEIFDLRKSLESCMDMQVKLQRCIMQEVSSFAGHSGRSRGTVPIHRTPRKETCCLCNDSEVDSLLYRCGHMCTCFNCAHELQQGSGKCPICRTPILDVVRTHSDHR